MHVHTEHVQQHMPTHSLCSGLFSAMTGGLVGGERSDAAGKENAERSIPASAPLCNYSW